MLDLLERNDNVVRLGRYLPREVVLAHKDGCGDHPDPVENDAGVVRVGSTTIVVVGLTHKVPALVARPLLGLLGLAAAQLAGADVRGLPPQMVGGA